MRWTSAVFSLALAMALPGPAFAQSEPFPNRAVRVIAPAGPGGNPDVLGRLLAAKFAETLGKPFVVENVPGAGGVVAANMVAKAPQDGHVLMLADSLSGRMSRSSARRMLSSSRASVEWCLTSIPRSRSSARRSSASRMVWRCRAGTDRKSVV